MTYCLALKMNDGLVFASDSRTNAGVDQIGCFKKMRTYSNKGDRCIVTMSSGNLSVTQSAINLLEKRATDPNLANIWNAKSLFDIATLIGDCLREARKETEAFMGQSNVDLGANFLIGGQIRGGQPRLFLIYPEGNFIEASEETPFFQIGETKYGKPVLDRFISSDTSLANAIKCTLVSFDSTMRSNISVGLPIDLVTLPTDSLEFESEFHITEDDEYFSKISDLWRDGLGTLFEGLPEPVVERKEIETQLPLYDTTEPEAPVSMEQIQLANNDLAQTESDPTSTLSQNQTSDSNSADTTTTEAPVTLTPQTQLPVGTNQPHIDVAASGSTQSQEAPQQTPLSQQQVEASSTVQPAKVK